MRIFLIALLALLIAACAENRPGSQELTDYIPANSAVILRLQNPDLFFSDLKNNEIFRNNEDHPFSNRLVQDFSILRLFSPKSFSYITFSYTNNKNMGYIYITHGAPKTDFLDSIQNKQVETFTSDSYKITKYTLEGKIAFSSLRDSVFILSNSRDLLEESLNAEGSLRSSEGFQKGLKAASNEKPTIFFNHQHLPSLLKDQISENWLSAAQNFSDWTVLDADINPSSVKLNGISVARDSIPRLMNVFRGTGLSENQLASITPLKSQGFYSVGYRDYSRLQKNLQTYRGQSQSDKDFSAENTLFENSSEMGMIYLPEGSVFAVRILDPEAARLSFTAERKISEEFRGFPILEYSGGENLELLLTPLINPTNLSVYCFLDSFILFSESTEALKEIITSYQNGGVLSKTEAYLTASENLSSEASLLLVANNKNFKKVLSQNVSEELKEATSNMIFESFPVSALQFIYQENFTHVHALISKATVESTEATSQTATVSLGTSLGTNPVFFENHRSNGMDVAVQDINNTLYLISASGKIYWKKQLESPILGEVQSVDILRNGRIQLAFATQNQLHIIDREGNTVRPFPLKFRDPITQPLAVFDYDNNRDYRFVVVQNEDVLMYDRKGNRVKGFRFNKASDKITQAPKHIRLGRKDYILIPEESGKLNILSRTGRERIPLSEKLEFSNNNWYEYNGNFLSANNKGEIIKIDEQGKIKKENLDFSDNVKLAATEKTFVSLSENELRIKETVVNLDYGLYTAPKVFLINNKVHVSVTDLQAHKVYLFNSNAELFPGFPVYGNSPADLANADEDAALELVVQGDEDSILIYEVK